MSNSKYPQQLDTSVEIPPVRDNITEIGSDVINSLRAAIFNIEKTLGINPQGSVGNSVAARISKSLDENGNILKDALTKANVLSGPIIDADVSKVAGIKEDKLRLDFPTKLLQSEISSLNSQLELITSTVENLSTELAVHLSPYAINVHKAKAISVDSALSIPSDIASVDLESGTVQSTFEKLYNGHINYSGFGISEINNSHRASQIYYDNTLTNSIIPSTNIQDALSDLADIQGVTLTNALSNIASNGRIRKGKAFDYYEDLNYGSLVLSESKASYVNTLGLSYTTFTLINPIQPLEEIKEFDILSLKGSNISDDNKDYQVKSVTLNGLGQVQNISIYGGPKGPTTSEIYITITKNPNTSYNLAGFASVVRPRKNKTNTPDVQVLNPDSATIITKGIQPSKILSNVNSFNISIDGGTSISIDTYNPLYSEQTLDTIVQTINDQAVDQHLNFTAYKVKVKNCYELALAHNIPNFHGDIKNRTLTISIGSSNDGVSELGLSNYLNKEIEGISKNTLLINGKILSGFGKIISLKNSDVQIYTGSLALSLSSGNFSDLGVRVGDLVVIEGSTVSTDDGSYRVLSVSSNNLDLDLTGVLFSGELSENAVVYIIRSSAPIGEFTFEEIGTSDGTILFDVFVDEEKDIFGRKRLEVEGSIQSSGFSAVISDVSNGFILEGETAIIEIDTNAYATLTDTTGSNGESVFVGSTGIYKIFASDGLSFITLTVNSSSNPSVALSNTIYGFKEVGLNNYHISRGSFATSSGRILGTSTDPGIPSLVDKRISGTVDTSIISDTFIERYIEGPRNELRSSGVVRGCLVSNTSLNDGATPDDDYQLFSISAGVIYVNGIRFEFPGVEDFRINTLEDYIIAIDGNGCVIAAPYITNPDDPTLLVSPYFENNVAYLAEVSNDGSTTEINDLRLFVDNLDLKVLGSIKVSKDQRTGHFTSIHKAVAYAKRYKKLFPELSPPSILIEAGEFYIGRTVLLDFDINIVGAGPNTVILRDPSFDSSVTYNNNRIDMTSSVFMIGGGQNISSDLIKYGITLKDFTYKSPNTIKEVCCAIALTQPITKAGSDISPDATYRIQNINFIGPNNITWDSTDADCLGDYALYIGQQVPTTLAPVTNIDIGNVIMTGCYLTRMGLEYGGIKFIQANTSLPNNIRIKNIIVSSNILQDMSPNVGDVLSIAVEYPSGINTNGLTNVIELGNARI